MLMRMLPHDAICLLHGIRPNPNVVDFVELDVVKLDLSVVRVCTYIIHVVGADTNESVATTEAVDGLVGVPEAG